MTELAQSVIKKVVRDLLLADANYRVHIVDLLNAQFLEFAGAFLRRVATLKLANPNDPDWYKKALLSSDLPKDEIAISAGINLKTIGNIRGAQTKRIVVEEALKNYHSIENLVEQISNEQSFVQLSIKSNGDTAHLNAAESLIVINAIAVKRAAMRGGMWSAIGKRAEKPLMLTLCNLFSVRTENYDMRQKKADASGDFEREVDFFLTQGDKRYKCEVKLMGKGNPESGDAVIARASDVFIADTLSETNIKQLNSLGIEWAHLNAENGFLKFGEILKRLNIAHKDCVGDFETLIDRALNKTFS